MQSAIGPLDTSNAANPILDLWIQIPLVVDDGSGATVSQLAAPVSIGWSIVTLATEARAQTPVQVASGTVDLTADRVPDATVGHYAANTAPSGWTLPSSHPLEYGRYAIVWSVVLVAGGPTVTVRREFDLIKGGAPPAIVGSAYATVSDLRDEGVTVDDGSDLRLMRSIALASRLIDRATGRFFEPRFIAQTIDGTGGRAVQFGDPLIALQSLTLGNPVVSTIGLGGLRLFNRHITQRLLSPDDRDDPKIEFVHFRDIFGRQRSASVDSPLFGVPFRDLFFPSGVQNVNVTGLWGYTDPDGSPAGDTPIMVRHCCKLIVMREWRKMNDDLRDDRKRHRLTSEKTRDQSYTLDKLSEGHVTGDREIDDILLAYRRTMRIGGA
jgi:hypothetical protein